MILSNLFRSFSDHCCIGFDMWTDGYRRIAYITYTFHSVTVDWKLHSRILKTAMFEHPHTAYRIEENFNEMIKEYELQNKEIISVVDGGANVNLTVDNLGFVKIKCIAHSINRLIQHDLLQKGEGIDDVKNLILKLRKIQKNLLFSYGELTKIANVERQKQIFEMLEHLTSIEEAMEIDERYSIDDLTAGAARMDGLKSISTVRWNCIYKVCQSHYQNACKCVINLAYFSV